MSLNGQSTLPNQLAMALGFVFAVNFLGVVAVACAKFHAAIGKERHQQTALNNIHKAFQNTFATGDIRSLQEAVESAHDTDVHSRGFGEWIVDHATCVISEVEDLKNKVQLQQRQIDEHQEEIGRLQDLLPSC